MPSQVLRIIALVGGVIVLVLEQVSGSGLVTNTGTLSILALLIALIPNILAEIQRVFVTPVAAPVLPAGTPVTTPQGAAAIVIATK